jgi:DNA polymerase III epsilon subunit-like protein
MQARTVLVFDTETRGFPTVTNVHYSFLSMFDSARVVELAWSVIRIEQNKSCTVLYENGAIWKPWGYDHIPVEASNVHRITTERAFAEGVDGNDEIDLLLKSMLRFKVERIIAHNAAFDMPVLKSEFVRRGKDNALLMFNHIPCVCTMKLTINLLKIPFKNDSGEKKQNGVYKFPKLSELHVWLFDEDFPDAHAALVDVKATVRCVQEMIKRDLLSFF